MNISTNCQYYENLRIASRISAILGESVEAHQCADAAETVKHAINNHLLSEAGYRTQIGSKS